VTEQPLEGGAAFWAARGVRIEPEVVEEEPDDEPSTISIVEAVPEAKAVAEPGVEAEAEAVEPEAEPEPRPEPQLVAEPEDVATQAEPDADPESGPGPDPDPAPEPEPELEPTTVPGFPQQRTSALDAVAPPTPSTAPLSSAAPVSSAPSVAPVAPAASTTPASAPGSTNEPAWQLTGGELAVPLPPLKTCIEAILMVVDEPVTVMTLAQVLERPKVEVADALAELAEEYTVLGRGFELREVGLGGEDSHTGWRVYSRAECAPVVERFVRDGQQAKLTQAALETLAVVAYRQPVSRSKVSAIRGVNCDGVMRTLLARGLVEEYGNDLETGAVLYQTTGYFLERMGLKSLDELPELAPLLPSAAEVDVEDFA